MVPNKSDLLHAGSGFRFFNELENHCHTKSLGLKDLSAPHENKIENEPLSFEPITLTKFWHPGEWIWKGDIPKSMCYLDSAESMFTDLINYFRDTKWKQDISNYSEDCWDGRNPSCYDHLMEFFLKDVWLTHEYITGQGFTNLLNTHWNPRLEKIVVHPGGARRKIEHLFGGDSFPALFFNTGGIHFDFLENMEPLDLDYWFDPSVHISDKNEWWKIDLIPDHGSMIPHCSVDLMDIIASKKIWYERLYNRTTDSNFKIFVEDNSGQNLVQETLLTWFENAGWLTHNKGECSVYIRYQECGDTESTQKAIVQSVYTCFAEVNFETQNVEVVQCN